VLNEFLDIYSKAPIKTKRKLLNVVVEEIRCSVKRGKRTGEIFYKVRGDGTVRRRWDEADEKRGLSLPLFDWFESSCSLAPRAGLEPLQVPQIFAN